MVILEIFVQLIRHGGKLTKANRVNSITDVYINIVKKLDPKPL